MSTQCYRYEERAKRKCAENPEIQMKSTQLGIAGHYSDIHVIYQKDLYLNIISQFHLSEMIGKVSNLA